MMSVPVQSGLRKISVKSFQSFAFVFTIMCPILLWSQGELFQPEVRYLGFSRDGEYYAHYERGCWFEGDCYVRIKIYTTANAEWIDGVEETTAFEDGVESMFNRMWVEIDYKIKDLMAKYEIDQNPPDMMWIAQPQDTGVWQGDERIFKSQPFQWMDKKVSFRLATFSIGTHLDLCLGSVESYTLEMLMEDQDITLHTFDQEIEDMPDCPIRVELNSVIISNANMVILLNTWLPAHEGSVALNVEPIFVTNNLKPVPRQLVVGEMQERQILYPIGWSEDGKFSWVWYNQNLLSGASIHEFNFQVQNMVTDKILHADAITYDFEENDEAYYGIEAEYSDRTFFEKVVWKQKGNEIIKQLEAMGIPIRHAALKPVEGLKKMGYELREKKEADEGFTSKYSLILSNGGKEKVIYNSGLNTKTRETEYLNYQIMGYFKSPYENRIAILLFRMEDGYDESFEYPILVGAHLDKGFK